MTHQQDLTKSHKFFGINSKDKVYGAIEKGLGKGYDATVNAAQKTFGLFGKRAGA